MSTVYYRLQSLQLQSYNPQYRVYSVLASSAACSQPLTIYLPDSLFHSVCLREVKQEEGREEVNCSLDASQYVMATVNGYSEHVYANNRVRDAAVKNELDETMLCGKMTEIKQYGREDDKEVSILTKGIFDYDQLLSNQKVHKMWTARNKNLLVKTIKSTKTVKQARQSKKSKSKRN